MGRFFSFLRENPINRTPIVLFIGVLILHLGLLPFVQNYDADSATRILISRELLLYPKMITSGIWAPGHFYLTALSLAVWDSVIWAPKVLHVVIGSLIVVPVYRFSKRRLNTGASVGIALFIALCPIIFRNSYHALGAVPFVLLTAMTLVRIDSIIHGERQLANAIWAGLFMTLAASMRYETWLLMAILTAVLLVRREWKTAIVFAAVSGVFPLLWMVGNYAEFGDPMYFLEGVKIWNLGHEGVNDVVTDVELTKRHLFFLYSLGFVLSPWILISAFFSPLVDRMKSKKWDPAVLLTLPFVIFLLVFIVKAGNGTLLTQHRFTCALVVLFVPFLRSLGQLINSKVYLSALLITLSFMSYKAFYADEVVFEKHFPESKIKEGIRLIGLQSSLQLKPIPRLLGHRGARVTDDIRRIRLDEEPVVIDFLSWPDTHFILLRLSEYTDDNAMTVDCGPNQAFNEEEVAEFISESESAMMVIGQHGKLKHFYEKDIISIGGVDYKVAHFTNHWECEVVRITRIEDKPKHFD